MIKTISNIINSHPIGRVFRLQEKKAVWKKVKELKPGVEIAIEENGSLDWDEVVSIKKVGRERVYDIEVEGTHNFVGNGIVAHNTYINGIQEQQRQIDNLSTQLAGLNLTDTGDLQLVVNSSTPGESFQATPGVSLDTKYEIRNTANELIERIGGFAEVVSAKIRSGLLETENAIVNNILVAKNILAENVTSYTLQVTQLFVTEKVVSPTIETSQLIANEIQTEQLVSGIVETDEISIKNQELSIKNNNGEMIAAIDSEGNATVAGTLYAKRIESEDISNLKGIVGGLLAKVESLLTGGNNQENETKTNDSQSKIEDHKDETGVGHDFNLLTENNATNQQNNETNNPNTNTGQLELSSPETSGAATAEANETWATSSDASESTLSWDSVSSTLTDSQSNTPSEELSNTASGAASLTYEELLALLDEAKQEQTTYEDISANSLSLTANLYVYGQTNLSDAFVTGTITQGATFQISGGNTINVLNGTLYLQTLGGGLDIASGAVTIDGKGNAVFAGDVTVKGKLATNDISPLPDSSDINIHLGGVLSATSQVASSSSEVAGTDSSDGGTSQGKSGFGRLLVKGLNGKTVASIDAEGNASFSGQLIADSLKLSSDLSATYSGLIIAASQAATKSGILAPGIKTNGTTGVGILPAGETEVVVFNNNVSNQKLIYLTPTSETENKVVYVKAKKAGYQSAPGEDASGYFVVAIDKPIDKDIRFNWWIIN